jgi:CBS domain containing-hemolysin-like protein
LGWYLAGIVVLLGFSALFSGSETALFSLRPDGRRFPPDAGRGARPSAIDHLLADPARLLGTLLLANLLVNTGAAALFTLVATEFAARHRLNLAVVLGTGGLMMTLALLIFGEVTPKVVATRAPLGFARLAAPLLLPIRWLLHPLVSVLVRVGSRFGLKSASTDSARRRPEHLSDEELHTMIELGRQRGVLAPGEEEILSNLVGLEKRTVSEVMTPRIDIVGFEERTAVREATALARSSGLSRLPVYRGTRDDISGIVYAKELLAAPDPDAPVATIARRPFFVPGVKRLLELLDELRRKGSHIAIVVDEFGQTAGLVTLEDLLEAVFGEITDEYDVADELPYTRVDATSYMVDGEIDIATLNRLFRGAFRGAGHQRLSAFICDRLGRLPEVGDTVLQRDVEITVREARANKVEKVLVRPIRAEAQVDRLGRRAGSDGTSRRQ